MNSLRLIFAAALTCACSNAFAGASEWHHVEGAAIRLVTEGAPDTSGVVRGALEIKLKPGWKTYWRDPGASGVPPTLQVKSGDVAVDYPTPKRFDEGHGAWAGYDSSVAFALTLRVPAGSWDNNIVVDAFLGVCETICIPVQAELSIPLAEDVVNSETAPIVEQAFSALPSPARTDLRIGNPVVQGDEMHLAPVLPEGVEALDLFVAGNDAIALGTPRLDPLPEGGSRFTVPVLYGVADAEGSELPYTLITSAGTVSGVLTLR